MSDQNQDLPFAGADFPDGHGYEATSYPWIQWVNGDPKMKKTHPVLFAGGWAMQTANVLGTLDWSQGELVHKNGESTPAYLTPHVDVAFLATKFRWFKRVAGRMVYLTTYEEGARGKFQVLVVVRGAEGAQRTPWMLTTTGMSAKALTEVVKAYKGRILPAASSLAKRHLPLYAFWTRIAAGSPRTVGTDPNTSVITPPVLVLPDDVAENGNMRQYLIDHYVGQETLDRAAQWYDEARTWAQTFTTTRDGRRVTADGEIIGEPDDYDQLEEPPPGYLEAEDIPF